ncbi:uncharacterized protein LOC111406852 [Olea europaea var. sylvestris]|uniref:uncharacterized protein LOC111406852 n=1 Tax=Olea europaea var. sylvestris TaxID=158386 RepID=UPI000C1D5DDF|nr:uncharacterized protein LOC111406852 [Olea europaea var. sylvestris]
MIDAPPKQEELSMINEIDPHVIEHKSQTTLVEELESFPLTPGTPRSCHYLKIDPKIAPHQQKRRAINSKRYKALKEEVQKLIKNGFIREAIYPKWVSNPVLVKKHNGYNQIPMYPADEESISFTTDRGLYCYKMMPFGLKNAEATYQRLVNKMFMDFISKTVEVYIDDMLVKCLKADNHVTHLNDTFRTLGRYRMKFNPLKCAFGVESGQFLSLTGQVAALSCFVSKATDKCLPLFKVLKAEKKFEWNEECEEAFQGLKRHLGQAPFLSKRKPDDILQLYLAISNEAISTILTREEGTTQLSVYYTSKTLLSPKTRYPDMKKLALALITTSRKLRPYFRAHTIHMLTNFPLRAAIKGQTLADFVAEFTNILEVEEVMELVEPTAWNLFVDSSVGDTGLETRVVLVSPEGHKLNSAVRFRFTATNNAAEYGAFFASLKLAKEMQVRRLRINSDSQLVVSQVNDSFSARDKIMASYLKMVLPANKDEAYKLRRRSAHFLFIDDVLYKIRFSSPLLRCVGGWRRSHLHFKRSLRRYLRQPLRRTSFGTKGLLPKGRGGANFAIVAIDYFTKWVKAEPLTKITEFDNKKVRNLCKKLGIKKYFSIPHHPQANGQVEDCKQVNQACPQRKLDASKGAWVDDLPQILWPIRTTTRTPTWETPFLMAYGTETISPVEVDLPSPRRIHFNKITNDELRRFDLDFIDERRYDSQLRLTTYQRKMTKYFNSKVKKRSFRINSLVLRRVFLSSKGPGEGHNLVHGTLSISEFTINECIASLDEVPIPNSGVTSLEFRGSLHMSSF